MLVSWGRLHAVRTVLSLAGTVICLQDVAWPYATMRKQYHLRPSERGLLAWDVHRLVGMSAGFPVHEVPLRAIRELDEEFWFGDGTGATCRAVAEHARLMAETDLRYPIILSSDGRVMDGMHRVAKALLEGREVINAVRFEQDPEPDFVGVGIDDLPSDDPG